MASRTAKTAEALQAILGTYDLQEGHDVSVRHTLYLCALPVYLREDDSEFFKTFDQEEKPGITDTPLALLTTSVDTFSTKSIFVVVEGDIVIRDIPRLPDAFIVLFGLIYAFILEYPKNSSTQSPLSRKY